MKKILFVASSVLALSIASGAAMAQDPSAQSSYGSVQLDAGFTPDPYTVDITSGGSRNASLLPGNCRGWVAEAPDFDVYYQADGLDLTIAAVSDSDTTLVINAPDGSWYCDDDGGEGLNPLMTFNNPQSGRYDIWIGSYSEGDYASAILSMSELGLVAGENASSGNGPDFTLEAGFGSVSLEAGFTPDPYVVSIVSGGGYSASTVSSSCRGWVAEAPDYSVNYLAGSFDLTIAAVSNSDTTLLVNGPNGEWYCDDDGGEGLNPLLNFSNPASGRYDVWVGSYSEGEFANSTLSVSEIGQVSPHIENGIVNGPDVGLDAAFGNVVLATGFAPDPHRVDIISGGQFRASDVNANCAGWVAAAPDVQLSFTAGTLPLIISAASESDTTLMINDPYGNWYCNDDGGEGLNPSITFDAANSGVYDIWIGSYSEGNSATASLSISELYSE